MIRPISNFGIGHRHHPLHQAVSLGVEPSTAPEGFHKSVIEMGWAPEVIQLGARKIDGDDALYQ